jgi:hypothetical protein
MVHKITGWVVIPKIKWDKLTYKQKEKYMHKGVIIKR